jgi:hypothetical protein
MVLGVVGEHSSFVLDEDDDYKWLAPAVAARKDVSADGPWTLYDLLVLIPKITPAELLQ